MSLISLRLPDDLEAKLNREAASSKRGKSEIARAALSEYLAKQERERFIEDYIRAALSRDPAEQIAIAEEALPLDNEALEIAEGVGSGKRMAREPRPTYGRKVARRPR